MRRAGATSHGRRANHAEANTKEAAARGVRAVRGHSVRNVFRYIRRRVCRLLRRGRGRGCRRSRRSWRRRHRSVATHCARASCTCEVLRAAPGEAAREETAPKFVGKRRVCSRHGIAASTVCVAGRCRKKSRHAVDGVRTEPERARAAGGARDARDARDTRTQAQPRLRCDVQRRRAFPGGLSARQVLDSAV